MRHLILKTCLKLTVASGLLVASTHGWQERIVSHLESMLPLPVRSLGSVLTDALALDVFNPASQRLTVDSLTSAQDEALAAALPALGAALRSLALAESVV